MTRYIGLMVCFLFGNLICYAQNPVSFTGRIFDTNSHEPLIGARVFVESGSGTLTDDKGDFSLALPPGNHDLVVTYLGYTPLKVSIHTDEPTLGTLNLSRSSTSLQEIIVSASPLNYSSDFKGSNFRISPKAIENTNPLNTEEILRSVPGVNIIGDMGLSNRPNISIRGSWGRRSKKVYLMEDGSPSAPAPYIAPGAYYNPVSDRITAIEIYKGADMLRFGPNNMYGAVNYITALPPQKPTLRVKLIGGQRQYATGLFSYGGTWNNMGALVEGVYKHFDGFTDNASVEVLNLNAKLFASLTENQSLYFKLSGQFEENQASLSALTPFSYTHAPQANPFDADVFTMRRYGVDVLHKWSINEHASLTSKVYASDFERDWWRQVTTKIRAADALDYLGPSIFEERFSYLQGLTPNENDYIRVGKLTNGRESTTDSRWTFSVAGVQETFQWEWAPDKHTLEVGLKAHRETFHDRFLQADSSRWARSGTTLSDLNYGLGSASGYVRNEFQWNQWGLTPIVRMEYVKMFRQDQLALSQQPGLSSPDSGKQNHSYGVVLPGLTLSYQLSETELFASVYQGFIAPSKVFGFLVEQDGVIRNPLAGESINIQPELSINTELGWRGALFGNRIDGQCTYFNNTIRNFYAGGRSEVFQELGVINMQGIETGIAISLLRTKQQTLGLFGNGTFLRSNITSGQLNDRDLFSQVSHSSTTRAEYLDKVNANRSAYEIYTLSPQSELVLLTDEVLTDASFDLIQESLVTFGQEGIQDASVPYVPNVNLSVGVDYTLQQLAMGISGQYVGKQFTEYNNFVNESADGAIGQLPAFFTMDAYVNYDWVWKDKADFHFFANGKNLTNQIYRASRLNRATSGIYPGGFRQIIIGVTIEI